MTDQAAQPQRVASRHAPANEVIAGLRDALATAAKGIADLGNSVIDALDDKETAMEHEHEAKVEAEDAVGELVEWRALLEDYRRGIVDRDELLEKTVGRG